MLQFPKTSIARCKRFSFQVRSALSRRKNLTVFLAVLSLATLPRVSYGQDLIETSPQAPTSCASPYTCCTEFTIAAGASITMDLYGPVSPTSTSCFDWACFTAQGIPGLTLTHPAANEVTASNTTGGPLNFTLCGDPSCMTTYKIVNMFWHRTNGASSGYLDLNKCGNSIVDDPCLGCDYIRAWNDGSICLTRGTANNCDACQLVFTFTPGLPPCVIGNIPTTSYDAADWGTPVPTLDGDGNVTALTFTNNDPTGNSCLHACESFCFKLPHCCSMVPDGSGGFVRRCVNSSYTVSGVSVTACFPANTACPPIIAMLKPANGTGSVTTEVGGQNYPNPLEASTQFKTTIPFGTSQSGVAVIKIANEKGDVILSDNMEVLGQGEHFFYFTADNLPAGKYFYTIEFPQGKVIVSKSMLIVK